MTKRRFVIILLLILFLLFAFFSFGLNTARADELSDNIEQELENIDLTDLEKFSEDNLPFEIDFNAFNYIKKLLNGEYDVDFISFLSYIKDVIFGNIFKILPILISVIAIAIFSGLIVGIKGNFASDGISDLISIISVCAVIVLLTSLIGGIFYEVKNTTENIAKLTEIMSPIILTLMVGSGGIVSAQVYQPVVLFLSNGITQVFCNILIPLVGIMLIFNVLSNFSINLKLKKYNDFLTSLFKWIIGITVTIFGVFLSVQGISSATHDGISIKAAKYTISNSIPLIGGFLKEGFDLILAGSILIKNAVGISGVFILIYMIIPPVLFVGITSLLLKLTAAIIEPISDGKVSDFCFSLSKSISNLAVILLMVSFMFFITVLLMIFSASSFI